MNPSIATALLQGDGSVLCQRCALALGVRDVAVVVEGRRRRRVLWASSPATRRLAWWESSLGEGPATDAVATNAGCSAWLSDERPMAWPAFAVKARAAGVASSGAAPIRRSGRPFGALVVYGDRADAVTAGTVVLAGELAAVVATAITRAVQRGPDVLLPPEEELVSQATGMVAVQRQVGVGEAFGLLRALARDEDVSLEALAGDVVECRRTLRIGA